jgi:hypothetical protein
MMTLLSGARAHAQLAQDEFQRAPVGKRALQQIGADKGGERQPLLADKKRAAGQAQRQRHEYKNAREHANELPGCHVVAPLG